MWIQSLVITSNNLEETRLPGAPHPPFSLFESQPSNLELDYWCMPRRFTVLHLGHSATRDMWWCMPTEVVWLQVWPAVGDVVVGMGLGTVVSPFVILTWKCCLSHSLPVWLLCGGVWFLSARIGYSLPLLKLRNRYSWPFSTMLKSYHIISYDIWIY